MRMLWLLHLMLHTRLLIRLLIELRSWYDLPPRCHSCRRKWLLLLQWWCIRLLIGLTPHSSGGHDSGGRSS